VQRLLDYLGMKDQYYRSPQDGAGPDGSCSACLPAGFSIVGTVGDELDQLALQYLLKRGISRQQIVRYKVGATFVGNYAYRVVFPLWYNGKLQGFVARDIAGWEPRYLSGGRKALFNPRPAETLILAEGVFKALRIERALGCPVGATLGRELTDYQLEQLLALDVRHIVLWPDPDKAGRQGCIRSAELLRANGFDVSVVWPVSKPADEALLDEIQQSYRVRPYNWQMQAKLMLGGD
jgi:DNA primase